MLLLAAVGRRRPGRGHPGRRRARPGAGGPGRRRAGRAGRRESRADGVRAPAGARLGSGAGLPGPAPGRLHAALADAVPGQRPRPPRLAPLRGDPRARRGGRPELEAVARRASNRGGVRGRRRPPTSGPRCSRSDDAERARRLLAAGEAAWRAGGRPAGDRPRRRPLALRRLTPGPGPRPRQLAGDVAARGGSPAEALRLFLVAADQVRDDDPSRAVLLLAEAVARQLSPRATPVGPRPPPTASRRSCHRAPGRLGAPAATGRLRASGRGHGRTSWPAGPGTDRVRAGRRRCSTGPPSRSPTPCGRLADAVGPLFLRSPATGAPLVRPGLEQSRARSAVATLPVLLFLIARDGATTDALGSSAEADYGEVDRTGPRARAHHRAGACRWPGWPGWRPAGPAPRPASCTPADAASCAQTTEVGIARGLGRYALGELALAHGDVARRRSPGSATWNDASSRSACATPTCHRRPTWSRRCCARVRSSRPGEVAAAHRCGGRGQGPCRGPGPERPASGAAGRRRTAGRALRGGAGAARPTLDGSRRPAPGWRTAPGCAAAAAGRTPARSCGPPWTPSSGSAPGPGRMPPPPSWRPPARPCSDGAADRRAS